MSDIVRALEYQSYSYFDYRALWGSRKDMPWGDCSWWLQVCNGQMGHVSYINFKDLAPVKET